jgi:transposase
MIIFYSTRLPLLNIFKKKKLQFKMPRGTKLTEFEKGRIEGLKLAKLSNREIAKNLNRSPKVVNNYLKSPSNYGKKRRPGRKPLLTPRDKRLIIQKASNRSISVNQIKRETSLQASKSTIWRVINSNPNIKSAKKKQKPKLTELHKKARLDFAKKYFTWKSEWTKVIFSDEKKFNLDGPDGYRHYWHDLRKEPLIFSKRHSGGGSLMVWAGFCSEGATSLGTIHSRSCSADYIQILNSHLLPFCKKLRSKKWIFQQDNASIHSSAETKNWLASKKIELLDWPANSPDLNPMENLWGILARRVYKNNTQYNTVEALREAVEREWKSIENDILHNLVDSMNNRIFETVRLNGAATKY